MFTKIHKCLFVIIISVFCFKTTAQNEHKKDSLWQVWRNNKLHDTIRLDALETYVDYFYFTHPKKALNHYKAYLKTANKSKNIARIAYAHTLLGSSYQSLGDFDKAITYYDESVKLFKSINDPAGMVPPKINTGHIYSDTGRLEDAIVIYKECDSIASANNFLRGMVYAKKFLMLSYYEQNNYKKSLELINEMQFLLTKPEIKEDKVMQVELTEAQAAIYGVIGKTDEAIEFTKKTAKLYEELYILPNAISNYRAVGELQLEKKDTLSALKSLHLAYNKMSGLEDDFDFHLGYYAMSLRSYLMKDYKLSEKYIDSALIGLEKQPNANLFSQFNHHLGLIKLKTNQPKNAIVYCTKALKVVTEIESLEPQKDCFDCLYEANNQLKNYKAALYYLEQSQVANDSIFNEDKIRGLAVQETENEFNLERQETSFKHQAEIKEQEQQREKILGGSVAILSITGLGFLVYTNRRKRKTAQHEQQLQEDYTQQLLQNTEDERSRIAGDLHDSVNHQLLHLKQKAKSGKSVTDDELANVIEQVRTISHNLSPVMFEQIGLVKSIEGLCRNIMGVSQLQITTQLDYQQQLSTKQELQLYRVVEEALNNIIKHSKATNVFIKINSDPSKLEVKIKDNGIGFKTGKFDKDTFGFGLTNIKQRTKSLKGKLNLKSNTKGAELNLKITI